MMTIVTHVAVKEGAEPEWDAAMRDRLASVRQQPGWIASQIMIPLDKLSRRIIIGTWQTRADWEAWHANEAFIETRKRMEGLESEQSEEWWHEVVVAYGSFDGEGSR